MDTNYQSHPTKYDVFISHSSIDKEQVDGICTFLEGNGIKCFVSYRDIPSGVSYPGAITRALRECDVLLLVLTKASNASKQVDRELTMANDSGKKMSCIRLEDIPYSDDKAYLMSGINWLDAFPNTEQQYKTLLQDIRDLLVIQTSKSSNPPNNMTKNMEGRHIEEKAEAEFQLGMTYLQNPEYREKAQEGFEHVRHAAENGVIDAILVMAQIHDEGGPLKNMDECIKWLTLGAEKSNKHAQCRLGQIYMYGIGDVERNPQMGYNYLVSSAQQNHIPAIYILAELNIVYANGNPQAVQQGMAQLSQCVQESYPPAFMLMGQCCLEGRGVAKDHDQAVKFFKLAANNGIMNAALLLAKLYNGEIEEAHFEYVNPEEGKRWLGVAEQAGYSPRETHEFVDLGLPSGTLWATCNVGATKPEECGQYFAWGEIEPKTVFTKFNYQFHEKPDELTSSNDPAQNQWGEEWCVPSISQLKELIEECIWIWTDYNNVKGVVVKSKINGNSLFLPASGFGEKLLSFKGTEGNYWARSLKAVTTRAHYLNFNVKTHCCSDAYRYLGFSIRPVRAK